MARKGGKARSGTGASPANSSGRSTPTAKSPKAAAPVVIDGKPAALAAQSVNLPQTVTPASVGLTATQSPTHLSPTNAMAVDSSTDEKLASRAVDPSHPYPSVHGLVTKQLRETFGEKSALMLAKAAQNAIEGLNENEVPQSISGEDFLRFLKHVSATYYRTQVVSPARGTPAIASTDHSTEEIAQRAAEGQKPSSGGSPFTKKEKVNLHVEVDHDRFSLDGRDSFETRPSSSAFVCDVEPLKSSVFIVAVDKKLRVSEWNEFAAKKTGYLAEDVLGRHVANDLRQIFAEQDASEVERVLKLALSGTQSVQYVLPIRTKSGETLHVLLTLNPRLDLEGNYIGVFGIGQDITRQLDAEREVSVLAQDLRRLIDTANAPILGIDAQGIVTEWNDNAALMTGFTKSSVVGRQWEELVTPQFRSSVRRALDAALRGEPVSSFDAELMTDKGMYAHILLSASPRYNANHEIVGVVGVGQDITLRIARENEFEKMVDLANAPIFGVDIHGRIDIWNQKTASVMGITFEQAKGKDLVKEFISPDKGIYVQKVLEKCFSGQPIPENFEFALLSSSGAPVELQLTITARKDSFGQHIIGLVAIGQDITQKIASEKAYYRLIDSAHAPILGLDAEGRIDIWNQKIVKLTGYTFEEAKGRSLVNEFVAIEKRAYVGSLFSQALKGLETPDGFECPLIAKEGARVEILLNATPRKSAYGDQILGVVGIGQDVTEKIATEREYYRLIDNANAPIFALDRDGQIQVWNQNIEQLTGHSKAEAMKTSLVDRFVVPEDRKFVRRVFAKVLEGREWKDRFEVSLMNRDGGRVDIVLNAMPRSSAYDNQIIGLAGIGQDVTETNAQERAYYRLIDRSNAPIFGVDSSGAVDIWNQKIAHLTGFTWDQAQGRHFIDEFVASDKRWYVKHMFDKCLRGEETPEEFECPIISGSGDRVMLVLNLTSRQAAYGNEILGVLAIGRDLTEKIVKEQEYRRLLDNANAPIFGVNSRFEVEVWNRKIASLTGISLEQARGKNLIDRFVPEDQERIREIFRRTLSGMPPREFFQCPLSAKDGARVEILLNVAPQLDAYGKEIIGLVGIGQDITEKLAKEQEYYSLIDHANAPIFGVDMEGKVTIWNLKAASLTGVEYEEAVDKTLVDNFIAESHRDYVRDLFSAALQGRPTPDGFECPLKVKGDSSSRVEILLNVTSRRDAKGNIFGIVGIGQDVTEKNAREQEYHRLIETANAPIFGIDINGIVNIWNQHAVYLTNYQKHEVLGHDLVQEFITPDYRDSVKAILDKALQGVETANFEFPLITREGARLEILLNANPRRDAKGNVVGVVGIGQDITQRVAQEKEHQELIQNANAPIIGTDIHGRVTVWNRKAASITHFTEEDVMGRDLVEDFIIPEFRDAVNAVIQSALQGEDTANFEFPLITRRGIRVELLLSATPRRDHLGNIVGMVGIGQDITERIAQEKEYYRLIESANAPIFSVDAKGQINEWNQKIEEITGYSKAESLGRNLVRSFVAGKSRSSVRRVLDNALIGLETEEFELPFKTRRGEERVLLASATARKDVDGNIMSVVCIGQDLTARKKMEEAKVTFLASFSHELRTPLNGILGMLELLVGMNLDEEAKRYAKLAYISGSLLLNLINDILDLSKIEAGRLEVSCSPFNLRHALETTLAFMKPQASSHNITLSLEMTPDLPPVVAGDVMRLRQVILNLISNAVKFTPKGGHVTVSCECSKEPREGLAESQIQLLFKVIDNGIGMNEDEIKHLFSMFMKLSSSRKQNPTGSGLGLAICKQLVELMGGRIGVRSKPRQGSTFFFTVVVMKSDSTQDLDVHDTSGPLFDVIGYEEEAKALLKTSTSDGTPANPEAHVLIVEDNNFNMEVVQNFLVKEGHTFDWAMNGKEAVRKYEKNSAVYDLILMDCEMPVMDGYEATVKIREFEQKNNLPRAPVVGLTAFTMLGDREKCLKHGMDDYLSKPVTRKKLNTVVLRCLADRTRGRKESVTPNKELFKAREESPLPPVDAIGTINVNQAIETMKLEVNAAVAGDASSFTDTFMSNSSEGGTESDLLASVGSLHQMPHFKIGAGSEGSIGAQTIPGPTEGGAPSAASLMAGGVGVGGGLRFSVKGPPTSSLSRTSRALNANNTADSGDSISSLDELMSQKDSESSNISFTADGTRQRMSSGAVAGAGERTRSGSGGFTGRNGSSSSGGDHSAVLRVAEEMDESIDPIDYESGLENCGGDEELYSGMLHKFAKGSEMTFEKILQAYREQSWVNLHREAHSLKGASGYVAAERLRTSAYAVEMAGKLMVENPTDQHRENIERLVGALNTEYRGLRGFLKRNYGIPYSEGKLRDKVSRRSGSADVHLDGQSGCNIM